MPTGTACTVEVIYLDMGMHEPLILKSYYLILSYLGRVGSFSSEREVGASSESHPDFDRNSCVEIPQTKTY